MQILTSYFHNDISIYKKFENCFNIVFETKLNTDKNIIDIFRER